METKKEKHAFTPGPWVVGSSVTAGNKLEGCSIFAEKIKDQIGWMRFDLGEENQANARLIASGPEMLEALRVCLTELEDWNRGHEPSEGQELARELLAKVEGGEG